MVYASVTSGRSTAGPIAVAKPLIARAGISRAPLPRAGAGLLLAAATTLAACGGEGARERSFEEPRTYEPVGREVNWEASSAERFGISAQDFAPRPAAPGASPGAAESGPFVPEGWVELPSTQFREANFRVAGDERAECYLSSLAGEGGGLAANVNRWRHQMSLAPLSPAEVEALPREPWLGLEATFVDFTGTWTGMDGAATAGDWRLVGLLAVHPGGSRFLKMTGPAELVAREVDAFRKLAASLGAPDGHEHGPGDGHDHGAPAIDPTAGLPPGHPPTQPVAALAEGTHATPSGFLWTPPAAWERGADKPMREITYLFEEGECYVTVLAGDGGGLAANLERWCQQMGQPSLAEEEVARLPRVPMLGGSGVLVELERGIQSSAPQEHLLGLVLLLEGQSVFVKMTGPRALLERERPAFLEFCRSARSPG